MPPYAFAENHHARSIAGWIKCEMERKDPARECVRQERNPRTAQEASGLRTNGPYVGLCVIDVTDFERPVSVPGRSLFQLPVEGLILIRRAGALTFQRP